MQGYIVKDIHTHLLEKGIQLCLNASICTEINNMNKFVFTNLEDGKYSLAVLSANHKFGDYEVEAEGGSIAVYRLDFEKRTRVRIEYTDHFAIHEIEKIKHFQEVEAFDVSKWVRSPFGIIVLVTLGLYICSKNMPSLESLQEKN